MKTLVLLCGLVCGPALAGQTILILPFDDFSGSEAAQAEIARHFAAALQKRGWTVSAGEGVEAILQKERVRYLDPLEASVIASLAAAVNAQAVLSGTIYTYSDARNPAVAVSARICRADGTIVWADIAAISGDDTERMLGFGRKLTASGIAADVVAKLVRSLPRPDAITGAPPSLRAPRARSSRAVAYNAHGHADGTNRVCVLPFENLSSNNDASRLVADVLSLRLAGAGFEVVDQAALRAAAIESHIGSFRGIATDDLARLADAVKTPLFIRGSIDQFVDPAGRGAADAELQVEFSLVDVREQRVIWAVQHARRGGDYVGFLMHGKVTTAAALADRVLSEMVKTYEANHDGRRPSHQQRVSELRGKSDR